MLSEIQRTWQNPRTSWGHKCLWEKNNVQPGHRESLLSCVREMLLTPGFPASKWLQERKMIFYCFIIINNNNIKSYYQFVGGWHMTHHMWWSREKIAQVFIFCHFHVGIWDQIIWPDLYSEPFSCLFWLLRVVYLFNPTVFLGDRVYFL